DDAGLRQQRILVADEGNIVATEGERLHAEWQARRAALLGRGAAPSFRVSTVTELKDIAPSPSGHIEVTMAATELARTERPHGKRFGILVHAMLSTIDLGADRETLAKAARAEGRLVAATEDEVLAAASAAEAALAHELFIRARGASTCRRETP